MGSHLLLMKEVSPADLFWPITLPFFTFSSTCCDAAYSHPSHTEPSSPSQLLYPPGFPHLLILSLLFEEVVSFAELRLSLRLSHAPVLGHFGKNKISNEFQAVVLFAIEATQELSYAKHLLPGGHPGHSMKGEHHHCAGVTHPAGHHEFGHQPRLWNVDQPQLGQDTLDTTSYSHIYGLMCRD